MNAFAGRICMMVPCFATLLFSVQGSEIMPPNSFSHVKQYIDVPYDNGDHIAAPHIQLIRQDYEQLQPGRSVIGSPMKIGNAIFDHGLGSHANSHIRVISPIPINKFSAIVGVDNNDRTMGQNGSVVFRVEAGNAILYESPRMTSAEDGQQINISANAAHLLDLYVSDAGDGPNCDHADWADASIELADGQRLYLDQMPVTSPRHRFTSFPFSFTYDGLGSDEILQAWPVEKNERPLDVNRTEHHYIWREPSGPLRIEWRVIQYHDFPAVESLLHFENTGTEDTGIIENIQPLDFSASKSVSNGQYRLHTLRGGTPDERQFEPNVEMISKAKPVTLSSGDAAATRHSCEPVVETTRGAGRSSSLNMPFFKLETGDMSIIGAIGWSGGWKATFEVPDERNLHVRAGLFKTHFRLHPGERVRQPRILLMYWNANDPEGPWEANAQFRQLIQTHYVAPRKGDPDRLPVAFCNTCFTRGGGWLDETTAENQIALINAYSPMGLDALLTDAGWFEGGMKNGRTMNWIPDSVRYPEGMKPVAAEAMNHSMIYGLWFEPERVIKYDDLLKTHPEWVLGVTLDGKSAWNGDDLTDARGNFLFNMGISDARQYFLDIVFHYMDLPGFNVYRQDLNMDIMPYWETADAPDRIGMTEIKYIEGLYKYWDSIAERYPDSLREECAGGGHRIDLETVMRMHIHQKTDFWGNYDVNQAALWSISQYLPNNVIVCQLGTLEDYDFHSCLAASLGVGWIADAPDFPTEKGIDFIQRYRAVRHLLTGSWYPLSGYSRAKDQWLASQYHRDDLDSGLILVFRREDSPYPAIEVSLHKIDSNAKYELSYDLSGIKEIVNGIDLTSSFLISLAERRRSEMIVYNILR